MSIYTIMGIILLIFAAILIGLLLLRLRVRYVNQPDRHRLFAGLGRSGVEIDYRARTGSVKLFGMRFKSISLDKPAEKPRPESKAKTKATSKSKAKKKTSTRKRSFKDMAAVLLKSRSALWRYTVGLLGSLIVEELEAKIEAGFDEPDLTGITFGYYQAALGAVPAVVGRLNFVPDWTGPSFAAQGRVAVALPMYRLVGKTLGLLRRLPLREIAKVTIGRKEGVQDVKQRS